jgi:YHS domain-containing protein
MSETVVKTTCGGILKDPSLYPSADFNGETVYFCNKACLNAFLENPTAFMAGEIEHPLEEDEETNQPKEN